MKLNILSIFALSISTIFTQSSIFNQDKPLHIGVSIGLASRSHIKYLLEILEQASQKGHRVTYLSTDEFKPFSKGYNVTHYSLGNVATEMKGIGDMMPFTSKDSVMKGFQRMTPSLVEIYQLSFPLYEKFYREEKPDLMICDFLASSCIESAAKNTIPMMIGYQSLMFSTPAPYLTKVGGFDPTTIESFSFLQRLKHSLFDLVLNDNGWSPIDNSLKSLRNYYEIPKDPKFPKFGHLGLGIANSFIGFENPRKITSHMNVIGPIVSEHVPELPQHLQSFLDTHSNVLYVAFGSVIHLKPELAENLLQHFQRALNDGILDGIIWGGLSITNLDKFPKSFMVGSQQYSTQSILDGNDDKIKLLKWAPQEAILNHPNTKLFLSHGGLDSIYESLNSGTPMLVLPFLADQPRNAILVKENGIGDYIEWPTMSDEVIYDKFVQLLNSNNLELQSKVNQLQLITKFSSKRKTMAADLIETYAYSAKSCRVFETPKPFEVPCELKPFLPLDYTMSSTKANLIDTYIALTLLIYTIFITFSYIVFKTTIRLYPSFGKRKLD